MLTTVFLNTMDQTEKQASTCGYVSLIPRPLLFLLLLFPCIQQKRDSVLLLPCIILNANWEGYGCVC